MNRRAVLVGLQTRVILSEEMHDQLDELAFLAQTSSIHIVERFVQKLVRPDARTHVGKGKISTIRDFVFSHDIDSIIFDDDLSPSQVKNIEREFNPPDGDRDAQIHIIDRSLLILEIFLHRAQTMRARTQVRLAMHQYLLPRLTGMWTHLERQRGGTGTRGGSGEKEIETDRRNIRKKIAVLKEKLSKIDRQARTQRNTRSNAIRVSLVGYTNAGKSTLMNVLAKSHVLAENKLFATVDTIVRRVEAGSASYLLSDTVGFIRKLPPHLIDSFRSTLDEVTESNILLHVVDVSHRCYASHIEVVGKLLVDIGAGNIPVVLALNKIDLLKRKDLPSMFNVIKSRYASYGFDDVIFFSSVTGENISVLKQGLVRQVKRCIRKRQAIR